MKIGIDTQSTIGEKTGIGFYTRHLLEALQKSDSKNIYKEYNNPRWTELNTLRRLIWENIFVPFHALMTWPSVLLVPGFAPPLFKLRKTVVVLHDLIGVLYPQNLGYFSRFYWSRWLPFCVKHADFIICDSESTRRDCLRILKVRKEKVKVVYPGITVKPYTATASQETSVLKKYGIKGKYALSLSTIEPRKNFPRLVEAWARVRRDAAGKSTQLVIVGRKDWGWPALKEKIESLGLEDEIITVGYVTDEEKDMLYRRCEFFIFPSLYEGFGLPVVEAMSFEKPLICANRSSLPEIADGCALFVDPDDPETMATTILAVMKNRELRQQLSENSLERCKLFSWEKAAREVIAICERVAKE